MSTSMSSRKLLAATGCRGIGLAGGHRAAGNRFGTLSQPPR